MLSPIIETTLTNEGEGCFDRWTVISSEIDSKQKQVTNIMTQATNIDIREIKDLIVVGNATTQKQISDLDKRIEVGFAKVEDGLTQSKLVWRNAESECNLLLIVYILEG